MWRTLLSVAGLAALVYLGLCVALFAWQRSLIYFPQPRAPGAAGSTIRLPVDGAELLVTTRAPERAQALLYFGGNAEDVAYSLPDLAAAFPEHALYLLHYRGYGGSSGQPSETALFADALALFDRVQADHRDIVVIGRSLGSGVAVHLASRRPVARLVLVTPYDSLQDLAARQFPLFPARRLLRDKFESWRYAPQVSAPTLLIAAEHDEIIPRASSEALLTRFKPGVARLVLVSGSGHNSISDSPEYLALLKGRP
jgi:pimeloyl-ACP methyl ester carboxylesterase